MSDNELKRSMSQKLRMDGRNYSRPGWYFVTFGADYHRHFFGAVVGGGMRPNALGELVGRFWSEIPQHYAHIRLGAWQTMPNHFHGLVQIVRPGGAGLGEVLNLFKGSVTREARRAGLAPPVIARHGGKERHFGGETPAKIWAPNYYDVICFNAEELEVRERYIRANPRRWALRDIPEGTVKQSRYKGNVKLLRQTGPRRALRVSRKTTGAQVTALKTELAAFDGLVCSTFFSPGERACQSVIQEGSARMIWVLPMAMPATIPAGWTDAFLQERALWLSAFPEELQDANRASCTQANEWVEQFCNQKRQPV